MDKNDELNISRESSDHIEEIIKLSDQRKKFAVYLLVETIIVTIAIIFWKWKLVFLQFVPLAATICFVWDPITQKKIQQAGEGLLMVSIVKSLVLIVLILIDLIGYEEKVVFNNDYILWDPTVTFGTLIGLLLPVCILDGLFIWGAITVIRQTKAIIDSSWEPLTLKQGMTFIVDE